LQAPDTAAGKRVKCPKCQSPIPPPDNDFDFDDQPPKKGAPVKKGRDDDYDDDDRPSKKGSPAKRGRDDDDYDDEPPPKKGGAVRKSRDDDDDDDRPAKKGAVKKGRDDDYDDDDLAPKKGKGRMDDDDDDDRPRKKGAKAGKGGPSGPTTDEERSNAFIVWVAVLVGQFIGIGPFGGVIWWFIKRGESKFVDHHGKELVNLLITYFLVVILGIGLMIAGAVVGSMIGDSTGGIIAVIGFGVGGLLMGIYALLFFIFMLVAMFKAKGGDWYRVPICIHLLKV